MLYQYSCRKSQKYSVFKHQLSKHRIVIKSCANLHHNACRLFRTDIQHIVAHRRIQNIDFNGVVVLYYIVHAFSVHVEHARNTWLMNYSHSVISHQFSNTNFLNTSNKIYLQTCINMACGLFRTEM